MPKITYLKEFDGALWARLELDMSPHAFPVYVLTEPELREIKDTERKAVWQEIRTSCRYDDSGKWDYDD